MRIAIIGARSVPARWGGFETVASEIAPRLVARGHDVVVYCRPKYSLPSRPPIYKGVRLQYLPALYTKSLESLSHEVLSAVHATFSKFDLLYVLGFRASFMYLAGRLTGQKIIINTDGFDWQRRKWGRVGRVYLRAVEAIGSRWAASHLICDSRSLQPYFKKIYGRDTTYIGYGANLVNSKRVSILKQYCLKPRGYFLVVARIEPENNADIILRGFANVDTEKELVIVGSANYRSRYFSALRRLACPGVRFLGGIYEPGHIEEIFANSYAYIHGHEVGGTNPALLHAMGCGSCVLALDVPFNREIVANTGVFWKKSEVDLQQRMVELLADPNRAEVFRSSARERVRIHYSWETVADEYDRFFRSLTGSNVATMRHENTESNGGTEVSNPSSSLFSRDANKIRLDT